MSSAGETPSVEPKWEDILGNGRLLKRVLKAGHGQRPNMGNRVRVSYKVHPFDDPNADYVGYISRDPEFEKEDSFYLGDGEANMNALELAVALMNLGEKAVIKCTNPKLCYEGEPPEHRPENIAPSSNLFIVAELLADEGAALPWLQRPRSERLACASRKIERGNAYCRAQIFASAINSYSSALRIVGYNHDGENEDDDGETDGSEEQTLRVRAYSGLSAAHFNTSSFDNALKCCDDALRIDPTLVKVIFRRGRCLAQLGDYQSAKEAMISAKNIGQENTSGLNEEFFKYLDFELAKVVSKIRKEFKEEASLYRKMIPVKPLPPQPKWKKLLTFKFGFIACILLVSFSSFLWTAFFA